MPEKSYDLGGTDDGFIKLVINGTPLRVDVAHLSHQIAMLLPEGHTGAIPPEQVPGYIVRVQRLFKDAYDTEITYSQATQITHIVRSDWEALQKKTSPIADSPDSTESILEDGPIPESASGQPTSVGSVVKRQSPKDESPSPLTT